MILDSEIQMEKIFGKRFSQLFMVLETWVTAKI